MKLKTEVRYAQDGVTPLYKVRRRLEWVKRQIMAHPKQYDQSEFVGEVCEANPNYCKTIGCIAGWLDVGRFGISKHLTRNSAQIRMQAQMEIGLFETSDMPHIFSDWSVTHAGTLAHAEEACYRIDSYLEEIGA